MQSMKKTGEEKIGGYLFLVAIVLAVLGGVIPQVAGARWVGMVMLLLGLIVGLLNINAEETTNFLVASIALMMVSTAPYVTSFLTSDGTQLIGTILSNIMSLVAPAALIVALKEVYCLAKD